MVKASNIDLFPNSVHRILLPAPQKPARCAGTFQKGHTRLGSILSTYFSSSHRVGS